MDDIIKYWGYIGENLSQDESIELRAIKHKVGACDRLFTPKPEDFRGFCEKWGRTAHVFASINPRKVQETARVSCLNWFVLDLDAPQEGDLETAKRLRPTFIVSSGNGFHFYFRLDGGICIDRDAVSQRSAQAVKKLQKLFKGKCDGACVDPERVMRVPGTVNQKNGQEARIIYEATKEDTTFKEWYTKLIVEAVQSGVRQEGAEVRGDIRVRLNEHLSSNGTLKAIWVGDRSFNSHSERDFALASELLRTGWNKEETKEAIRLKRREEGSEKSERDDYLEKTVKNALKRALTNGQVGHEALRINGQNHNGSLCETSLRFNSTEIFQNVKETEWLVDGLIPKSSLSFIVGDPKTGKSYFALELALATSLGRAVADRFSVQQSRVLFLELEDGVQIMAPRYHALVNGYGKQPNSDQFSIYMGHELKLDQESAYQKLIEKCIEFKPGLIVVDTLAKCHAKDEISAKEMTLVVDKLARLRNDFGCAVFIVHHFNKGMYERKHFQRRTLRGSTVIEAAAECIIRAQRNDTGDAVDCYVTSKVTQDFGFTYRLNESVVANQHIAKITA